MPRKTARPLMDQTWSKSSSEYSPVLATTPSMPALLWRMSSRPKLSTAVASMRWMSALLATSVWTARQPSPRRLATSSWAPEMSAATTLAPSRWNASAVAAPMPEPAPVTTATLPSSRPAITCSFLGVPVGSLLGTGPVAARIGVGPLAFRPPDREPAQRRGSVLLPAVVDGIGDVAQGVVVQRPQAFEDPGRGGRVGAPPGRRLEQFGGGPAHEARVLGLL